MTECNRIRPGPGDFANGGALADLAFLADDAAQALQFQGHAFVAINDIIEGVGDFSGGPVPVERQADGKIPLLQSSQCLEEFAAGVITISGRWQRFRIKAWQEHLLMVALSSILFMGEKGRLMGSYSESRGATTELFD